jgi:hypothetical protein
LLNGVPGDKSDASSIFETDMFRDFMLRKLEDEKFFLNAGRATDGEPAFASTS